MSKRIPIRSDIPAGDVLRAAKDVHGPATRRLLAIAAVLDGMSRKDAAKAVNAMCIGTDLRDPSVAHVLASVSSGWPDRSRPYGRISSR